MKQLFLFSIITICGLTQSISAQEKIASPDKYTSHNKGKMYIFWGGNRESFSCAEMLCVKPQIVIIENKNSCFKVV